MVPRETQGTTQMTSQVYNQAIAHLGRGAAGKPAVCGAKRAHITVSREQFDSGNWSQCKRCAARVAKWEAKPAQPRA